MELTHASFFSGVGGLDVGLERAGWRTVSFSEIDPYASAVLAERWPRVPNLGDIVPLAAGTGRWSDAGTRSDSQQPARIERGVEPWHGASLWSGGFPCQDLSVAGKRRGLAGERSGLAFAFLDLVERHRPPAILLENVPGLLSSHGGKDLGALLGRLGELGYWWAYRILDAQFFGVPQRRRRVFICALHAGAGFGANSAAAVLSVGSRCGGHSEAGDEAGTSPSTDSPRSPRSTGGEYKGHPANGRGQEASFFNATARFGEWEPGDVAGNLSARDYKSSNHLVGPSPDSGGVRKADGLAGRLDDRREVAPTLLAPGAEGGRRDKIPVTVGTLRVGPQRPQDGGPGDTVPIIVNALDQRRGGADDNEAQAGHLVGTLREHVRPGSNTDHTVITDGGTADDPLLPLGLDSHRYRCCGNGVVSNVAEWIGVRLAEVVQQ